MQTNYHNFIGQSGFYHFFGIVEDRIDPLKQGRLKVRCFGIHTDDKTQIPTADLPWAMTVLPINGTPNSNPNVWEGDMVFGFFVDGIEMQEPMVLGVVSTNKGGNLPQTKGFTDPRSSSTVNVPQPDSTAPYSTRPLKPGLTAYATAVEYSKSVVMKVKKFLTGLKLPAGATFAEPTNPYGAQYPYNHAFETESGHVVEFDDTPGKERVHIFHRSGSFVEVRNDGTVVAKSVKDDYDLVLGNSFVYTKGNRNMSNDGTFGHLSGGAYTLEVAGGNMTVDVKSGNLNMTVNGNVTQKVSGSMNINCGGSFTVKASTINLN